MYGLPLPARALGSRPLRSQPSSTTFTDCEHISMIVSLPYAVFQHYEDLGGT